MTETGNDERNAERALSPRVDARFNPVFGDDMLIRISVRNLVEFILRSGSIDSRFSGRNRLEEGARVHRKLQKDEGYLSEVYLTVTEAVGGVVFTVEGRADGIIITDNGVSVDEIKSTLTPLDKIGEDFAFVHWAQAMCYGYMYCRENKLDVIGIRLTYYEMETGSIKRFVRTHTSAELSTFFTELLNDYAGWVRYEYEWRGVSGESMRKLKFPFANYREGQRRLAAAVYRSIRNGERLLAAAPTGVGKTISMLFPALKAMGETYGAKIFYLTAKTIARQAAHTALELLRNDGVLRVKSIVVTAKDRVCFLETRDCRPELCEYADGHYDRINAAIIDVLSENDDITAEIIANYANRHKVCPFELSLDLTLWCDVVICDYNYLFDPQVYLKRFFTDGGEYIFLVDEAHNLVHRAREMYSAEVRKSDFLAAKRQIGKQHKKLRSALTKINAFFTEIREDLGESRLKIEKSAVGELE